MQAPRPEPSNKAPRPEPSNAASLPTEEMWPQRPDKPLPKRPSAKHFIGRTFYDAGTYDDDGAASYEPGEFVVDCEKTGGYFMCIRKDDFSDRQKYKMKDVKEMVIEYEKENKWELFV